MLTSVAIDLFVMPEVLHEGRALNCFVGCVDRHSGWIVASPQHTKGLTAQKVAIDMYQRHWLIHGIPSVVTSDRGPHFVGAWWKTMCRRHGVQIAYGQAYHHNANGRAEVAGQQLMKVLRFMQAGGGVSWVEALPRALQVIHDRPGESGLSPYQILHGRHRPMAGIPHDPVGEAEDAVTYFQRQDEVARKVADWLNRHHEKREQQTNRRRSSMSPLKPGDLVWYLRPRGRTGDKLETWWEGPCKVVAQVAEHSYEVEVREGRVQAVHGSQLKRHFDDELGEPVKMWRFIRTREPLEEEAVADEWLVERILRHRRSGDGGEWELLVKWKGSMQTTWEPLRSFIDRYNQQLVDYAHAKGISGGIDVLAYLKKNPVEMEAAVLAVEADEKRRRLQRDADSAPRRGVDSWEEPPEDVEVELTWDDRLELAVLAE